MFEDTWFRQCPLSLSEAGGKMLKVLTAQQTCEILQTALEDVGRDTRRLMDAL